MEEKQLSQAYALECYFLPSKHASKEPEHIWLWDSALAQSWAMLAKAKACRAFQNGFKGLLGSGSSYFLLHPFIPNHCPGLMHLNHPLNVPSFEWGISLFGQTVLGFAAPKFQSCSHNKGERVSFLVRKNDQLLLL